MRVTTGLGAMGTTVSPSPGAVRARAVTQVGPVAPVSGSGRWSGTAEGARRSRVRSERESRPQWSAPDAVDWDELDRRHALRYELDQDDAERYRGSRQWSDREQFASDGSSSGRRQSNRTGSAPVSLRPARGRLPAGPPNGGGMDRSSGPVASSLPVGDDPTPLFTATEYVAVGDSPLYQFVAEFIATGDELLGQDVGRIAAADQQPYRELTESMTSGHRSADPVLEALRSPAPVPPISLAPAPVAPIVVRPVAVRPAPVESMADMDFPGGRHRDGWRVAGHRSSAESGRRSAARTPRHRAA